MAPSGAKVWHDNSEWVSTTDNNSEQPSEDSSKWVKINDLAGTVGGTGGGSVDLTEVWNAIIELSSYASSSGGGEGGVTEDSYRIVTLANPDLAGNSGVHVHVPDSGQYVGKNEIHMFINLQVYARTSTTNTTKNNLIRTSRARNGHYYDATQIYSWISKGVTYVGTTDTVFYTETTDPGGLTSDLWMMVHYTSSSTAPDYWTISNAESFSGTALTDALLSTTTYTPDHIGFTIRRASLISTWWKNIKFYVDRELKYEARPKMVNSTTIWGTYSGTSIFDKIY